MKTFLTVALMMASHLVLDAQQTPTASAGPLSAGDHGALDEFDCLHFLQPLDEKSAGAARLVLGDAHGFVHVYEQREGAYEEVWISGFLEAAVAGIHVGDVNADELAEILVYTEEGRFHLFDTADYHTIWSNPPNEYGTITSMIVENIDDDEQSELIFCADGRLVIYDGEDLFEEWRSDQNNLSATDMLIGDVDGDGATEIVLNDGFVFDALFRDIEWESPDSFGERIGLLDIDNDGILEIIGEFNGRFLRIFDVDERRMKITQR